MSTNHYSCRNEILAKEPRKKALTDFASLSLCLGGNIIDIKNDILIAESEIPSFQTLDEDNDVIEKAKKREGMCEYIRKHYLADCNLCHTCPMSEFYSNDNMGRERQIIATLLHYNSKTAVKYCAGDKEKIIQLEKKFRAYSNLNEGKRSTHSKPYYVPIFMLMYRMLCGLLRSKDVPRFNDLASVGEDVLLKYWNEENPSYVINNFTLEEYPNARTMFGNEIRCVMNKSGIPMLSPEEVNAFFFGEEIKAAPAPEKEKPAVKEEKTEPIKEEAPDPVPEKKEEGKEPVADTVTAEELMQIALGIDPDGQELPTDKDDIDPAISSKAEEKAEDAPEVSGVISISEIYPESKDDIAAEGIIIESEDKNEESDEDTPVSTTEIIEYPKAATEDFSEEAPSPDIEEVREEENERSEEESAAEAPTEVSDEDDLIGDDEVLFSDDDCSDEEDIADEEPAPDEEPIAQDTPLTEEAPKEEPAEEESAAPEEKTETPPAEKKEEAPTKPIPVIPAEPDFELFSFATLSSDMVFKYTLPADAKKREMFAMSLIKACTTSSAVAIEAVKLSSANVTGFFAWPDTFKAPIFVPFTDVKGMKTLSGIIKDSECKKVTYSTLPVYYLCQQNGITIRNLVAANDYRSAKTGPTDADERMETYRSNMESIVRPSDEDDAYLEKAFARFLYAREGSASSPLVTYVAGRGFVYDKYFNDKKYLYMNVNVRNVSEPEWIKSVNALMITLEKHASFDKHSARLCYLDYSRQLMVFEVEARDARAFSSVIGRQFLRILEVNCVDTPTCILTQNSNYLVSKKSG